MLRIQFGDVVFFYLVVMMPFVFYFLTSTIAFCQEHTLNVFPTWLRQIWMLLNKGKSLFFSLFWFHFSISIRFSCRIVDFNHVHLSVCTRFWLVSRSILKRVIFCGFHRFFLFLFLFKLWFSVCYVCLFLRCITSV